MKKYSVRLNSHQSQWLQSQASIEGISCSEYLRHLMNEQRNKPNLIFYPKHNNSHKVLKEAGERKEISYTIMAYQLLEQLILKGELGTEMREAAYAHTVELLTQFRVHPNVLKTYFLSVYLDEEHAIWLERQAERLGKPPTYVFRKILLQAFEESMMSDGNSDLHPAQKEGVKFTILTCILLERYIAKTQQDGNKIIAAAHQQSERLYAELYPNP